MTFKSCLKLVNSDVAPPLLAVAKPNPISVLPDGAPRVGSRARRSTQVGTPAHSMDVDFSRLTHYSVGVHNEEFDAAIAARPGAARIRPLKEVTA